jgi:hypothetical protein
VLNKEFDAYVAKTSTLFITPKKFPLCQISDHLLRPSRGRSHPCRRATSSSVSTKYLVKLVVSRKIFGVKTNLLPLSDRAGWAIAELNPGRTVNVTSSTRPQSKSPGKYGWSQSGGHGIRYSADGFFWSHPDRQRYTLRT